MHQIYGDGRMGFVLLLIMKIFKCIEKIRNSVINRYVLTI